MQSKKRTELKHKPGTSAFICDVRCYLVYISWKIWFLKLDLWINNTLAETIRHIIAWSRTSVYRMVSNTTLFSHRSFVAWIKMFEWTRRILRDTDKLPIDLYWYIWLDIRSYWSNAVHRFSRGVVIKSNVYKECYPKRGTAFLLMTLSDGTIFRVAGLLLVNSPVTGEFPWQRPVTRSLEVFFHLCCFLFLCNNMCL